MVSRNSIAPIRRMSLVVLTHDPCTTIYNGLQIASGRLACMLRGHAVNYVVMTILAAYDKPTFDETDCGGISVDSLRRGPLPDKSRSGPIHKSRAIFSFRITPRQKPAALDPALEG